MHQSNASTTVGGVVVSCFVVLAVAETAARVASTVQGDLSEPASVGAAQSWSICSPVLGWERRPGYRGAVDRDTREFDADGFLTADSAKIANSGPRRVLFVGDSVTMGWGVSTPETFVEVAQRRLPDVRLINLGVLGYSSYQGRLTMERYLRRLEASIVVVSLGFNDRRYAIGPNQDGPETFERVCRASSSSVAGLSRVLRVSYAYRAMSGLMARAGLLSHPHSVRLDVVKPRVDEEHYRLNLSGMAEAAKRSGVHVMFLLLRDNPAETAHLVKGIDHLTRGDYPTAIEQLQFVVWSRTMFADLGRVYLHQAYAVTHDAAQAEHVLETDAQTSVHGGRLIRLDSTYNDIMRRVADDSGAELVDGSTVLQDTDYLDFCHVDSDGHRKLGELLADRIERALAATQPAPHHL